MVKRILVLGIAALALALVAPTIGTGMNVAHAQTDPTAEAPDSGDTTAPDSGDAPDAPDQGEAPDAPDQGEAPDAPDQGDSPDDEGDDAEDGPCASSGARASGESCPPPAAQPQQPQQPAPTSRPHERKSEEHGSSDSNSGSGSVGQRVGSTVGPQVVQTTTPVSAGIDTGTIPQGGIQAGAGGTADDGSQAGLLGGGALMLALAAGGLALRRRNALES
jgi:hypothetical protein